MSKSYSKIKRIGICCGSNTEFYRAKRRNIRAKEKQAIRDTLTHTNISDFDNVYTPLNIPFKDTWSEPTDGTITMTARAIDRYAIKSPHGGYAGVYTTKDGKIKK